MPPLFLSFILAQLTIKKLFRVNVLNVQFITARIRQSIRSPLRGTMLITDVHVDAAMVSFDATKGSDLVSFVWPTLQFYGGGECV